MNENNKIRIAKNIKYIFRLFIFSLIIGVLSYPILPFFNNGYNAINLKNEYKNNCSNKINDKCSEIRDEIIEIGQKENTTETTLERKRFIDFRDDTGISVQAYFMIDYMGEVKISDLEDLMKKRNELERFKNWLNKYNDKGRVELLSISSGGSEIIDDGNAFVFIHFIDFEKTIQNTIKKSFGQKGFLKSLKIFIYTFLLLTICFYLFHYGKQMFNWVSKYSK